MLTVTLLLLVIAIVLLAAHIAGKCPLWVSLLFVIVALLMRSLPL